MIYTTEADTNYDANLRAMRVIYAYLGVVITQLLSSNTCEEGSALLLFV